MRVLLTDGLMRKTLSAVRSLGEQGVEVVVADRMRVTSAAFSKYCYRALRYPDPAAAPQLFMSWLLETLEVQRIDVLIPMDDQTMSIVLKHREEIEDRTRVLLPPLDSYKIAADKFLSVKWAASHGVDCPETLMPMSMKELQSAMSSLTYPVVIKPRASAGSRGIRMAHTPAELQLLYREVHAEYPYPLLQECIPEGPRYDVCLLYKADGTLAASFVQKELRHFPAERGPSTAQESVAWPELIDACDRMLSALKWRGVAEVEFMLDPRDGKPKFMEINPRYWNSLHLSYLSGLNFPYDTAREALGLGLTADEPAPYKVGVRCRSLLPIDLLHFLTRRRRLAAVGAFAKSLWNGGKDDIISFKDPLPALGMVLACFRLSLNRTVWKMMFDR
ncbi:ATP-grasp domain-containing protein [Paenibacillus sp. YYML68]|uniref:carboxylate--amine ligase n=1 Tax=Paenibacillus sp. YYML68 TaxID=2909250 RepID=UPI00248FF397|nr:ATP-grasp domain-containing protein [Paenibacillus sp. YYML68]